MAVTPEEKRMKKFVCLLLALMLLPLCAPAEDPQALAQVLRQAAADPESRRRGGENAGKYYRDNFRKEVFLEKLQAVLEENCVK